MTSEAILRELGQPGSRSGSTFTFCMEKGRTATLTFDGAGTLATWRRR